MTSFTRKEFLRTSAMAGVGLGLLPLTEARGEVRRQTVRIGVVGVGARGTGHLRGLLARDDVEIPAVCDVDQGNLDRAVRLVEEAGHPQPEGYTGSETAWEGLVSREDLDGVVISTPWLFHTPIAVAAMEHGKYVGSEIPTALTLENCWNL
ncbi:MAG: Gfo/Idh/MocA family oxidoreductase, partial [Gemmatimonadota bacterium]